MNKTSHFNIGGLISLLRPVVMLFEVAEGFASASLARLYFSDVTIRNVPWVVNSSSSAQSKEQVDIFINTWRQC